MSSKVAVKYEKAFNADDRVKHNDPLATSY